MYLTLIYVERMHIYTKILQLNFPNAINEMEMEWLKSIISLSAFCTMFIVDRKRCLHVFSGETHGAPWHGVLRVAQEGKANHVSSYVPSYRNANDIVGCYEILSRRPRYFYRYVRVRNNMHLFRFLLIELPLYHSFSTVLTIKNQITYWLDIRLQGSLIALCTSSCTLIIYCQRCYLITNVNGTFGGRSTLPHCKW